MMEILSRRQVGGYEWLQECLLDERWYQGVEKGRVCHEGETGTS